MTKDFWEGYVPEPTIKKSLTVEATLKLALEALKNGKRVRNAEGGTKYQPDLEDNAITAIKQALAAPVQEPVASYKGPKELWLQLHGDCSDDELTEPVDYTDDSVTWCWHQIHNSDVRYVRADIATPPAAQRQWVGLSDEEAQWIYDNGRTPSGMMEMVEAKLKERNNG